jgi:hypothetical protein
MTITSVIALLGLCTPGLVISEIRKLVADRGRCTLAELGDHLRVAGVALPDEIGRAHV